MHIYEKEIRKKRKKLLKAWVHGKQNKAIKLQHKILELTLESKRPDGSQRKR